VWVRAYDRLKPYGEELTMLDRAPVLVDRALERTSAWANTYLGRDHYGRAAALAADAAAAVDAATPSTDPASTAADTTKETRA
jgi:hypothetical protein